MEKDTVLKLAGLSKISVSEAEAEDFAGELAEVLGMLENIKSFNKPPLCDKSAMDYTDLQADEEDCKRIEKGGSFTVPKVV